MRNAVIVAVLAAALAGCQKDKAEPKQEAFGSGGGQAQPAQTGDKGAGAEKPADPAQPSQPAGGDDTVRPPMASDLESYTKDLKGDGPLTATFQTSMGNITCELFPDKAPMTVANFVGLARGLKAFRNPNTGKVEKRPYYDGIIFHRVIPDFMIQTGDPLGKGVGGPGYTFADEFTDLTHDRPGILSMANAGPGTNGSQLFITERPTPHLDKMRPRRGHTVFGHCKEIDVIKKIARVPKAAGSSSKPAEDVVIEKLVISRGG
jgi:peptidyl-prolyl cis-trans isomerase A (cyclophilin A)